MRALLITLLAAGCFSPDIGEGALVCGDNQLCPEGFNCAGGHCYRNPPSIDAPVDGAHCAAGGFLVCSGHDLFVCAGDDIDAGVVHCDFGCNQAAGQCNLCDPGTNSCDSQGNLLMCDSMGLSQTLTPCTSDNKDCTQDICVNGGCAHPNVTDGTTCNDGPGGASGACLNGNCVCGDNGQPCCNGSTCTGGLLCMNQHCGSCGGSGQPCCTNQVCGPGFVCANNCQPCGGNTELCCANSTCESGFNCMGGHCQACGALNQACCTQGMQCSGTLTCNGVNCVCTPNCGGKACGADDGCGNPCQTGSCSINGTHCVSGQCVCDSVSCNGGCCDNNVCQPGTSPSDCGSGGRQCSMCIAACVNHACL